MKRTETIDHYIRLLTVLPSATIGKAIPIALEQVAEALCCTNRNANLILKKAQDLNWLTWVPGRGRGNRSVLTLQVELSQLLFGLACEAVRRGDINGANALVAEYAPRAAGVQERFYIWLNSQFGPRVESQGARQVDTLRMHYHRPLLQLDPAYVYLRSECHMVKQVFDCLVRFDARTGRIEPQLAYHWEADAKARVWMFYLRKGTLFHHGRALTAHDVRYTLERLRDAEVGSPYRYLAEGVQDLRVQDDQTLKVTLRAGNHLFLHMLSDVHLSILPQDYAEEMGEAFARMPVGTGPFRVVRNDESMLVVEAFEPYFRERALIDRIEMWIVPGYAADRYDLTYDGTPGEDWNRTARIEWGFQHLTFNLAKPGPMQCQELRDAIHQILNRKKMISDLGGTRCEPAGGFLPESAWEEGSGAVEVAYTGAPLRLFTFPDEDHIEDAAWIQEQCGRHGIPVEVEYVPVKELVKIERIREADMILDGGTFDENVELSFLDLLLSEHSFVKNHLGGDSWVQQQIAAMLQNPCQKERLCVLREIDRYLTEHRAHLPLYRNQTRLLSHPELQGIEMNAHGWIDFRYVWFKRKGKIGNYS